MQGDQLFIRAVITYKGQKLQSPFYCVKLS